VFRTSLHLWARVCQFSEVLSSKTKKATKHEIQYKILNFLSEKGNKMFVEFYNDTFSSKNFEEALKILNI